MSLTRDERLSEQETIIRWDGHKDTVRIFTASKAVRGKILRAGHPLKRARVSTVKGRDVGWFFDLRPLKWGVGRGQRVKKPSTMKVPRKGQFQRLSRFSKGRTARTEHRGRKRPLTPGLATVERL